MKNQYSICEWYLAAPGLSAIRTAAQIGYDGVQLSDLDGANKNFPLTDPRIQAQYLEAASENRIVLQAFQANSLTAQGGIRYPKNTPQGERAIQIFTKGLEACDALHVKSYLIASFNESNFRNDYEICNTIDMLVLFVKLAAEKGVQIAYEGFCTTDRLIHILEKVKGIKLCYDTLNPIRFGMANPSEELKRIGIDCIDHIHVKDAPENMIGSAPLGEGAGHLRTTLETLKALGYSGWYSEENYLYLPPMSQTGQGWDHAKKDLAFLRDVLED